MVEVQIKDADLQRAAEEGMDEFIKVFTDAILDAIGGELTAETMPLLNADQITLLAYVALRDEVMDGGFVQLIHNGWPLRLPQPARQGLRNWGLQPLYKIINKCHRVYNMHHEEIEKDCTQEEFDALYERSRVRRLRRCLRRGRGGVYPAVAHYVDEHIENFATIVNE
jgi:hypothetical protein